MSSSTFCRIQRPRLIAGFVAVISSLIFSQVSAAAPSIENVAVGNQPISVAVTPDGTTAYVSNFDGAGMNLGTTSIVDLETLTVINTVSSGTGPTRVTVTPDGSKVYVGDISSTGLITIISTATNTAIGTISLGGYLGGLLAAPNGKVYVGDRDNARLRVLDVATDTFDNTIIDVGAAPGGMVISSDGGKLYVANAAGDSVSVVETSDYSVTTFNVGDTPRHLALTSDDQTLFVLHDYIEHFFEPDVNDVVFVIDTSSLSKVTEIEVGKNAQHMALSSDGLSLYVSSPTDSIVSLISAQSYAVLEEVPLSGSVYGLAATPDGRMLATRLDSNQLAIMTPGIPDAPTDISVAGGSGEVTVSWEAPPANTGAAISFYTATSSPEGKVCTTADGETTNCTVTGLTNGLNYTFSVVATNISGDSVNSNPSNSVMPRGAPHAPTNVLAVAGEGQAEVSWTAPANDGGFNITGYEVTSSPGGFSCTVTGSAPLACTVSGLHNGTSYTFSVSATNIGGTSPASAASNAVTPSSPEPSPDPVEKPTKESIKTGLSAIRALRGQNINNEELKGLLGDLAESLSLASQDAELRKRQRRIYRIASRRVNRLLTTITRLSEADSIRKIRRLRTRMRIQKYNSRMALREARRIANRE